ncbi:hypothetical protein V6N13_084868 [Hibiscus sabdariffa]
MAHILLNPTARRLNEAIFKGAKIDINHIFDLCVLRLSWWCKALWPDVTPALTDVVASPIRLSSVQPRPKILEVHGWIAPHPHLAPVNIREEIIGCINECKDLDCRFQFVPREGNTVVDGLAKKGIRHVQPLVMSCFTGSNWTDEASLNA